MAAIWGIFLLALFVTILEDVTKLDSDQEDAYEELVQQQTIKSKLRIDAAYLIIFFWKFKLALKKKSKLKEKLKRQLDLQAMLKRFKQKRITLTVERREINDILEDMQQDVNYEVRNLVKTLKPMQTIKESLFKSKELQAEINEQTLKIYENSKKIFALVIGTNEGVIKNIDSLDQVEYEYDPEGNLTKEPVKKKTQEEKELEEALDSDDDYGG